MPSAAFWLVLVAALAVRALYVLQLASSPLYDYPVVDAKTYVLQAESLAAGNWLGRGEGPFWQPPLYPYLLGLVKAAFPDSFFDAIRWLQALFGSFTCALTYLLGARVFSRRVGLAAGLAAGLYGTLVFFDGELLPASLVTLLDTLGLLLLHRALQRDRWLAFLGTGVVFGLAALAVPTVLSFVVLAAGWIYWKRRSALITAVFALGTAVVIVPVAWRNYAIGDDPVLISYNSGINFYVGNNSEYEQTLRTRPGWEWDDLVRQPTAAGIQQPSQRSAYFWERAWTYAHTQPLDYLALLARKGLQFVNGHEGGRNQDVYYWRHYSSVLAATLWKWRGMAFPFGVVGPLALVGLALVLRQRGLDPTTLFVLAYGAGVIAFFPTARYRVPLLPVLLPLAAYAGFWLWDAFRNGKGRQGAVMLGVLLTLGLIVNIGAGPMDMEGDAEIHYNLGHAYADKQQADAARQAFARAVERDSTYWQAWMDLGSITAVQGDWQEAATILERVADARPERPEVWVNLAHSYRGLQQLAAAVRAYEQALSANPHQPRIYSELMQLHLQRGAPGAARQVLDTALERYPGDRDKLRFHFADLERRFELMKR